MKAFDLPVHEPSARTALDFRAEKRDECHGEETARLFGRRIERTHAGVWRNQPRNRTR
jgi:hypothetical protein